MVGCGERAAKGCDQDVRDEYAGAGDHEEGTAASLVDIEGGTDSDDQIPYLQAAIDEGLVRDAGDTGSFEDKAEVV